MKEARRPAAGQAGRSAGRPACPAARRTAAFVDFRSVWLAYDEELRGEESSRSRTSASRSRDGEFIAIVGPSGCGKSTFMKLATGLKHADAGHGHGRRRAGQRAAEDRRHGVPGADAAALAHHARQRAAAARDRRALPVAVHARSATSTRSARAKLLADRRPRRLRGASSRGSSPAACSSAPRSAAR